MSTNTTTAIEPALGQTWKDKDTRVGNGRSGVRIVKVVGTPPAWPDHVWIQKFSEDGSPSGQRVRVSKNRLKKRFIFMRAGV